MTSHRVYINRSVKARKQQKITKKATSV